MSTPVQVENELEQALSASIHSYCSDVVSQLLPKKDSLLSPQAKKERLETEIRNEIQAFKKRVSDGFLLSIEAVQQLAASDTSIDLKSLKENMSQAFSRLDSKEIIEAYAEEIAAGTPWCTLVGLNDTTLTTLYRGAEQIFKAKRYSDAESAFCFLTTIDPLQYAFWIGLGHSSFQSGKFQDASNAYSMASLCDPFSAWPHIYSANAYEAMHDFAQAVVCLHDAESACQANSHRDKDFEEMLRQRIANVKTRSSME